MPSKKGILAIPLLLIAIQLIDIAIHVRTGQAEPIRILSNVILGSWAAASITGKASARSAMLIILIFLGLNAVFIAMNGITNPARGDALRTPLLVFVAISTALTLWLRARTKRD